MGICHSGSHAGIHAGHPCPTQPGTQLPVTQSSLSSLQLVMKIRPHFISAPVRISPSQDCPMEMAKLLKPHVSRWLRCDSKPCVFGKEPAWPRRFTHHCLMPFTGTVYKCTQSRLLPPCLVFNILEREKKGLMLQSADSPTSFSVSSSSPAITSSPSSFYASVEVYNIRR